MKFACGRRRPDFALKSRGLGAVCLAVLVLVSAGVAAAPGQTAWGAQVLGAPVQATSAEELREAILLALTDRYAADEGIDVSAAEVSAYLTEMRRFMAAKGTPLPDPAKEPAADRAAREDIARAYILQRKIDAALFRQYGGRIARQGGAPVPLDAYRRFLEAQAAQGRFRIPETAQAAAFWAPFRADAPQEVYRPGSEEEARAFEVPGAPAATAAPAGPKAFDKTLSLQGIGFRLVSANQGSINRVVITPTGLTRDNTPVSREVDGTVTGAEVADLNGDGSPELYVYVRSAGSGSYGSVVAYGVSQRRSLAEVRRTSPKATSATSSSARPWRPPAGMAWTRSTASSPAGGSCGGSRQEGVSRQDHGAARRLRTFPQANIPLAVVEAKDNQHAMGAGMAQAILRRPAGRAFQLLQQWRWLRVPRRHLATGVLEQTLTLEEFPSPAELWRRYCTWKGWTPEVERSPRLRLRPQQDAALLPAQRHQPHGRGHRGGQNRVLLVMATGTGKTYTAFQIIWRLWKSGAKKRILFLADRNILIDQTMVNDFRPFKGAMAKLSPNAKGVERVDAQGRSRSKTWNWPSTRPPSRSTRATKSTSRSTRPSPARKKKATSTSSSPPTSSTSSWSTSATGAAPPKTPPGATSSPTSAAPPRSA
jgi:hypothetical protein